MRKVAGVLLAAAMVLPAGMIATQAGAAAAKPTCKSVSGTATFSPVLPKIGSTATVKSAITIKGAKLTGCTGGGVTGGTVGAALKFGVASNCSSVAKGATAKITGTVTIVWNTKASSTAKVTLTGVTGNPTKQTIAGSISTGLFKGSKLSVLTQYTLGTSCTKTGLASVPFKSVGALTIK